MARIFGEIEGYPEGSWFKTRLELSHAGLHRPPMHGISGNGYAAITSLYKIPFLFEKTDHQPGPYT